MSFGRRVLAIVGGGSVATSALRQLAQEVLEPADLPCREVLVFEPNERVGAGAAYQDDTASNLLNTRAGSMSPLYAEPRHFVRWLQSHGSLWRGRFPEIEVHGDAFLPRALFGLYMEHVYDESVELLAAKGIEVRHVRTEVKGLIKSQSFYDIHVGESVSYVADAVILATGNHESTKWDHLRESPGYFSSPYPCDRLVRDIAKEKAVCVLGTSLSAIDAVVSLTDAGHHGKLVMISRNDRLPSVRGEYNEKRVPKLVSRKAIEQVVRRQGGCIALDDVFSLLLKEVEDAQGCEPSLNEILRADAAPQHYIDCEVEEASAKDRAWQAVVYSLNESIDLIWHCLSDDDKVRFEQEFKSRWLAYRVSFPVQNAKKIQRLLHSGQLTVFSGCMSTWFDDPLGLCATAVSDGSQGGRATLYADCLVNATGYTSDIGACGSKLIAQMVGAGLAVANRHGGLNLHFESGEVMSSGGRRVPRLHVLGSLSAGTYFWTNAMSVNARIAARVVGAVISELRELDLESRPVASAAAQA